MTTTEILVRIFERVERGWCPQLRDGDSRCFTGAFYEVLCKLDVPIDDWMKERHRLLVLLGFESATTKNDNVSGSKMVAWNDAPGRTQQEVLNRIGEAILHSRVIASKVV